MGAGASLRISSSGRRALTATVSLLALTAGGVAMASPAAAQAVKGAGQLSLDIPAQDLNGALLTLAQQAGLRIVYDAVKVTGRRSTAIHGRYSPADALSRLLAGSGLTYRFSGSNVVTLETAPQLPDGTVQLGTLRVAGASGAGGGGARGGEGDPVEATYRTAAPVVHVTRETIDRFRGSSPADVLSGIPGVMSGEARNGAGSIDVNIRGMQGMGRVATTIDGAENGMMVYQGYQGLSNRTFVDPDLIAGIDIAKGSDASSRAIAGTVSMRTFDAADIVKPGRHVGIRVNLGFGGNTASPRPGNLGGYWWGQATVADPDVHPTATSDGMHRPSFLDPTSGSASVVAALKEDAFDIVVGYAHRRQGNYFAGTHGPGANPVGTGPRLFCYSSGYCFPPSFTGTYTNYYENAGISGYRAGEEVLNTQLETDSWVAKGTVRFGNGHALQIGYSGFRSEAGDILAANFQSPTSQAVQEAQTAGTRVDTGTLRYHWKPDDTGLVDLKANLWLTSLRLRNPPRLGQLGTLPEDFGLPLDFRTGNNSRMWGGDISNNSILSFGRTDLLTLGYGASFIDEDTHPTLYTDELNDIASRNGSRREMGAFVKAAYQPVGWLTLNAGLRYARYWSNDRSGPDANRPDDPFNNNPEIRRSSGGWSPSAGITFEPIKDLQLYGNWSSTVRMPTLFESVRAYTIHINPDLVPERSRNWEVGANLIRKGIFAPGDKAMFKLGYFNWNVKNYVAREYTSLLDEQLGFNVSVLQIYNIDRAKFSGLEFSGQYDIGGFSAQLAANYYTQVEFCQTTGNCADKTLSADYATNQVPPRYSVNLTLAQKLLDEKLTFGGRGSFIGGRAAGHGTPVAGLLTLISVVNWKPYATADLFADYKLTPSLRFWARVENLLDKYYVDPLSLVDYPAPGRTFRFGFTGNFGGARSSSPSSSATLFDDGPADWSGFHVGIHSGYDFARFRGRMTALDGTAAGYPSAERPRKTMDGFSFGGQIGYDRMIDGHVLLGGEADISRPQVGGSQLTYADEGEACATCAAGDTNVLRQRDDEARLDSSIQWLSTARARLGYAANDRLLLYSTAGIAFLRQKESRTQYVLGTSTDVMNRISSMPLFTESSSRIRTGYAVGGGGEYALDRHWSLSLEGIFTGFGHQAMTFPNARAGIMPDTTQTVILVPAVPPSFNFDDPSCFGNGFTGPGCFNPGAPAVTRTDTIKGTGTTVTGRRLKSGLTIPMIRVGVNFRF